MSLSASVVIPAHNAEATIERAVHSALRQSHKPIEVVVGCDGCSDATALLARRAGALALELPKANGSVARNAAFQEASGDIVFFLDADDWWSDQKIESHMQVWAEADPSFVIDRSTPILQDGTRAHWIGGLDRLGSAQWYEFLSYRAWASGSSFSVSRQNYVSVGGFSEALNKFQDVDFWIRCAHACGPAFCLPESHTCYAVGDAPSVSKTTRNIEENLQTLFKGWPFVSSTQRQSFASHAYLTAAEVTPWPASLAMFSKANWPVTKRFFWKSLVQSLKRSA